MRIPAIADAADKHPSSGPNIDPLDGVRGFAALLVLISHTNFLNIGDRGGAGVTLFFVLSSFLISMPFVKKPQEKFTRSGLVVYFQRRIKRILPMYYFVLFFFIFIQISSVKIFIEHLLFLRADGHLWSIPQEMLFYLVLPLVLLVTIRIFKNDFKKSFSFLIIVSIIANLLLSPEIFALPGFSTYLAFRLGVFLTGVASAYVFVKIDPEKLFRLPFARILLEALPFAIVIFLLFGSNTFASAIGGMLHHNFSLAQPELYNWRTVGPYGYLSALLILSLSIYPRSFAGRFFSNIFMRLLGVVSFSFYLIHIFIINVLINNGITKETPLLFIAAFIMTLAVSIVTYSLIERPFLKKS